MTKKPSTPPVPSEGLKRQIAAEEGVTISAGSPLFLMYPECYPINPDGPPIPELVARGKRAAGKAANGKTKPVTAPSKGRTRTKKPRAKK